MENVNLTGVQTQPTQVEKVASSSESSNSVTSFKGKMETSFLQMSEDSQLKSIYNYSCSLEVNYNDSSTSKEDTLNKLEDLIKLLTQLELLNKIIEMLMDAVKEEEEGGDFSDILSKMNGSMFDSFSYTEMSTEVEMSAEEFTQIMDHMNSSDKYEGLSEGEKMFKIMETASAIGSGSLYSNQV